MPATADEQAVVPPAARLVDWQVTETPVMVGSGVTVIVALADLVVSSTLVAVTTTEFPVLGAVSRPAEVIVPAEAANVTAFEILPVPVTVGVHEVLLPAMIVEDWQATEIAVITGREVRDMVVDPDLVGSATLVAVTVMEDASRERGAVRTPVALIEPIEADQLTAVEKLPAPCTVAAQPVEPPSRSDRAEQLTDTPVTPVVPFEVLTIRLLLVV